MASGASRAPLVRKRPCLSSKGPSARGRAPSSVRNWSIWHSPPARERIESRSAQIRPSGGRADVEAAIKIERRAAPLEPGADPAAVAQDQIDAVLAEQGGADDPAGRDAARAARSRAIRISWRAAGAAAARRRSGGTRMMICWRIVTMPPAAARLRARLLVAAAEGEQQQRGGARQDHDLRSIAARHSRPRLNMRLICPSAAAATIAGAMPYPSARAARQARRAARAEGLHQRPRRAGALADRLARPLSRRRGGDAVAGEHRGGRPRSSGSAPRPACRWCPQGGNTSMVGGATPDASGEALLALAAADEPDPRARRRRPGIAVCEAGVILAELHEAALAVGRRFPLTLGAKGSATIGGLVSTNAGGTQVLRFGTDARARARASRRCCPTAACSTGSTALKKDNRGYDLSQLLIGAEGTLGIVTAASLKLVPAIGARAVAWVGLGLAGGGDARCCAISRRRWATRSRASSWCRRARSISCSRMSRAPARRSPAARRGTCWSRRWRRWRRRARSAALYEALRSALETGLVADADDRRQRGAGRGLLAAARLASPRPRRRTGRPPSTTSRSRSTRHGRLHDRGRGRGRGALSRHPGQRLRPSRRRQRPFQRPRARGRRARRGSRPRARRSPPSSTIWSPRRAARSRPSTASAR